MEVSCIAEEFFLAAEDEIQICSGFFDPADPKRREKAREEILKNREGISTESTPAKQLHVEDWTKRRIKPQRNHSFNRKTRRYDCLKCYWNIPDIMDKGTLRWPLARQPTCSRK